MQIQTHLDAFKNCKIHLPIVGETEVVDGKVDVPEEVANLLLLGDNWSKVETGEEELLSELGDINDEQVIDSKNVEDDLSKLDLATMIKIAKEANLKGYQIFIKNEKGMRAFLRKKLASVINAENESKTGEELTEENSEEELKEGEEAK